MAPRKRATQSNRITPEDANAVSYTHLAHTPNRGKGAQKAASPGTQQ